MGDRWDNPGWALGHSTSVCFRGGWQTLPTDLRVPGAAVPKARRENGISRNPADSLPLVLPPSQIPYLARVAASSVAPAAADAFVLVFSSE